MTHPSALPLYSAFIKHPLTDVTIVFGYNRTKTVIKEILLGGSSSSAGIEHHHDKTIHQAIQSIKHFLDGDLQDLTKLSLDLSSHTPFQRRVLDAARKIGWGERISYSELARRAGFPGAARAAASVMRRNLFPLVVPCHRVVKSDGTIGGFMGKRSGKAVELKRKLLERESIL